MLAAYFYGTFEMRDLQRVLKDAKVDCFLNHECGGVMDHMANIIDAIGHALNDNEPGDREPHFPSNVSSTCPHCGGKMLGDGCTTVMHCESVDTTTLTVEPDSAPIFCDPCN
jgi:hypothetical protein